MPLGHISFDDAEILKFPDAQIITAVRRTVENAGSWFTVVEESSKQIVFAGGTHKHGEDLVEARRLFYIVKKRFGHRVHGDIFLENGINLVIWKKVGVEEE